MLPIIQETIHNQGVEGGAEYRMMRWWDDVVWDVMLEYTLRESVVSSNGVTIGYAYDNGYMGWEGKLVVMAIGPDGKPLLVEPHDRNGPAMFIDPAATGRAAPERG